MKTNIYIDGFNLYYGCLKKTPYKWLDVYKLCARLFPKNEINRIRYFTAIVSNTEDDPRKTNKQLTYLRALQTVPCLSIHHGFFLSHVVNMPLANPPERGNRFARVIKTEEKGSDVNLATYLLVDGYEEDYEVAIIISNDSDLAEPMKVVKDKLGLKMGLVHPGMNERKKVSRELMDSATFVRRIRSKNLLVECQFPREIEDEQGVITRPVDW